MAPPVSKTKRRMPAERSSRAISSNAPDVVDPVWIVKAIGVTIAAALVCGYATLCLLFYQGQWQLVLHPSRSLPIPARIGDSVLETIRFAVSEAGTPQLTGWWITADPGSRYSSYTVLFLPGGDGSLANSAATLAALHAFGINVFAFDYRGYGQSGPDHPNQQRMSEDVNSAWRYLIDSRGLSASKIVPYGVGVGGALAAQLAVTHSEVPAVLIDSPRPNLIDTVLTDPRTRSLPVRALFHERFDIDSPLRSLRTPKLILLTTGSVEGSPASIKNLVSSAADPKTILTLQHADYASPIYREQITRFLDQFVV